MNSTQLHNALADVISGVKSKKVKASDCTAICKAANEMMRLHDRQISAMKELGITLDLPLLGLQKMKVGQKQLRGK